MRPIKKKLILKKL